MRHGQLTHNAEIPDTPEPTIAILILPTSNLLDDDNAIPIMHHEIEYMRHGAY